MSEKAAERAVLLQDLAILVASLGIAHLLRDWVALLLPGLKPAVPSATYAHLLLVFVPTWAWCADRVDLYRVRTLVGPMVDLLRALLWTQGWGALTLSLILVAAQAPLNRSLISVFLLVSTMLLGIAKVAQRHWLRGLRGEILTLVMADDATAAEVGSLRGRRVERLPAIAVDRLRLRLAQGGVDEVVLPGALGADTLRPLLESCEEVGVPALVRVEQVDLTRARPRGEIVGPTLYVCYETQEPDRPARLVKALFDRLAAAVLFLLTLPLMAAAAILIKLGSPGPILFVQERGGLHGRSFRMLKFRTMRVGAEAEREALLHANEMDGPIFKIARDPRVTSIGRLLRRTSVDELPQVINVLLGHMSLVGPRPLPLVETRALSGPHRRRLSVRPGITGLWQVSGRNELRFEDWMALDLHYVDNWGLGLDLAVLLRTIPAMLSGRGAN